MRLNGHGTLTLEDARTWIEETGLCLFLPRKQSSSSIAPSFVEAVAGSRNSNPDPKHIALAEELLVRLEIDGVAVRLNLLGQPGEQPDYIVAAWVLPYVYALRGDRDWRRNPQLTGSRQVSPLAVHVYKLLEAGDTAIPALKHALGREVTEGAVLRAITELWQQLRIIPVISAPGQTPKWQLLRTRYQKAIAEGASTSQVTAISVLASIYLQAVIAASMEEVEMFLSPLTARSKIREVLRGLVATRQVHTISMGHAQHFYVAGTLPEFALPPTAYASASMPASAYFLHSRDEEAQERIAAHEPSSASFSVSTSISAHASDIPVKTPANMQDKPSEAHAPRAAAARKPAAGGKSSAPRPHFSRPAAHSRNRKPAQTSSSGRPTRRSGPETRGAGARKAGTARPTSIARWAGNPTKNSNGSRNGAHAEAGAGNGSRSNGTRSNGSASHGNGSSRNGNSHNRRANASSAPRTGNSSSSAMGSAMGKRNGHLGNGKSTGKPAGGQRSGALRGGSSARKETRPTNRTDTRSVRGSRKPALAAGAKTASGKRYGFTAPAKKNSGQSAKKRG